MKIIFLICFFIISIHAGLYSQILTGRSGEVTFFSSAPLEDIKAINKKVRSALNTGNGEIFASMQIKDFQFRKSLMQKHFNEDNSVFSSSGSVLNAPASTPLRRYTVTQNDNILTISA